MSQVHAELPSSLLKQTSRSFYLTMRVLPPEIREEISLAYLLARTSDTIADTELVPADRRIAALGKFRARVLGKSSEPLQFGELAGNQSSAAEMKLLQHAEQSIALLSRYSSDDQQRIRDVLTVIVSGQELDLIRFAHASEKKILALQSDGEMDAYTYRVAGCVGEFWTKMWWSRLFPGTNSMAAQGNTPALTIEVLLQNAVRYGKGLQLINILRDLPQDLRKGRCYLPKEKLSAAGLTPESLLDPASEAKLRPVYDVYLSRAEEYLRAGWGYTNVLPKDQRRLRLATAWPVLIGMKTISRLRAAKVLASKQPVKISRADVRSILFRSLIALMSDAKWKKQFAEASKG